MCVLTFMLLSVSGIAAIDWLALLYNAETRNKCEGTEVRTNS
jgi:hypothetical protein